MKSGKLKLMYCQDHKGLENWIGTEACVPGCGMWDGLKKNKNDFPVVKLFC